MSKLAVIFPGIGYTVDKPLLHYSRRIAADLGYESESVMRCHRITDSDDDFNNMRERLYN